MNTEQARTPSIIHTLRACAKACIDGEKGYLAAAKDVRNLELRDIFIKYATQRGEFVSELEHLIEALGGIPVKHGTLQGSAHRGFLDARVSMEGATDAVILGECERGELAAVEAYDHAFGETPVDALPSDVREVVVRQRVAIRGAYDILTAQDVARRRLVH